MSDNRPVIMPAPDDLTLGQRFALVAIAHGTRDPDVKRWALDTLNRASAAPAVTAPA